MLDLLPTVIDLINSHQDEQQRVTTLRRIILDEAYVNLDVCSVLTTATMRRHPAARADLIASLENRSRHVLEAARCEEGAVFGGDGGHSLINWLLGDGRRERRVTSFKGWSCAELYHFIHNKIAVLQAIGRLDSTDTAGLRIDVRVRNIRAALLALIDAVRPSWHMP